MSTYTFVEPETKEYVWDWISASNKTIEEYKKYYKAMKVYKKNKIDVSLKAAILEISSRRQTIFEAVERLR